MCTRSAADTLCASDMCIAHNLPATELVHVVREVSHERVHRLVTEKNLGAVYIVEALVDNLFVCCIVIGAASHQNLYCPPQSHNHCTTPPHL